MRIIGRIFDVLALICAAILPACSPTDRGKDNGKPYVAFVSNNAEEFWTYARRGTEAAAKEFKVTVEFRSPNSGDGARQHEILEDLQSKGVQAIAVSPNDSA